MVQWAMQRNIFKVRAFFFFWSFLRTDYLTLCFAFCNINRKMVCDRLQNREKSWNFQRHSKQMNLFEIYCYLKQKMAKCKFIVSNKNLRDNIFFLIKSNCVVLYGGHAYLRSVCWSLEVTYRMNAYRGIVSAYL